MHSAPEVTSALTSCPQNLAKGSKLVSDGVMLKELYGTMDVTFQITRAALLLTKIPPTRWRRYVFATRMLMGRVLTVVFPCSDSNLGVHIGEDGL